MTPLKQLQQEFPDLYAKCMLSMAETPEAKLAIRWHQPFLDELMLEIERTNEKRHKLIEIYNKLGTT